MAMELNQEKGYDDGSSGQTTEMYIKERTGPKDQEFA